MKKLSVIVPAFNSAGFLRETVDSLRAQAMEDTELVLVDDGSTDGTGALIDALAAEDAAIVALHQPNGGVSSARNLGLSRASGKYTLFLDSDDLYAPGALRTVFDTMEAAQADLGIFEMCRFGFGGEETNPMADTLSRLPDIGCWDLRLLWNFLLGNKCFRTETLRQSGVLFPPTRYSEDGAFIMQFIYAAAPRITGIRGAQYRYRRRDPADGRSVSQSVSLQLAEDFCTSLRLIRAAAETALARPDCPCGDPAGYVQEILYKAHYTLRNEFYRLLWGADDETLGFLRAQCAALEAEMTPATREKARSAHPDLGPETYATRRAAAGHPRISILLPHGATPAFYRSLYDQSMPLFEILQRKEIPPYTAKDFENLRTVAGSLKKAAAAPIRMTLRGKRQLDPRLLRVVLLLKEHRLLRLIPNGLLKYAAPLFLRLKDRGWILREDAR
ncbi:MAG: glycosyltransferase family 2 protein [Clostridia bacterium]|nr:glycosyltransferase family 2 protein [Clostridia bacterium]